MKITILADNIADQGLINEHGFSCWIEAAGIRVLFDTGQGSVFAENAKTLGIDLRTADMLVFSHGHYDHTGGLPVARAKALGAVIYAHPASTIPRYSIREGKAKTISMSESARDVIEVDSALVKWVTKPIQLTDGIGVTGPIPRITDYEDTGGPFYLDPEALHPDPIVDDLALWINTDRGLVVVVGCSHAGVVNTLKYALKLSNGERLHAVLGGFHLGEVSEERLDRTMTELEELGSDLIVPCHCTGEGAVKRLMQTFGVQVVQGFAGGVFRFD